MTFAARLDAARAFVTALRTGDATRPEFAGHEVDQIAAAAEDAHQISLAVADLVQAVQPDRRWRSTVSVEPTAGRAYFDETTARLVVALAGCTTICPHLRRGGPQPAWAFLALHRLDCSRCQRTYRKPPPGEDDRCDWCGARGVEEFTPIAFQRGPLLVFGDACPACAEPLKEPLDTPTGGAA